MKIIKISFLSFLLCAVVSCYEDKGNYNYSAPIEYAVQNENESGSYNMLRGVEPLVIEQKIISTTEGEILESNPNMQFSYWINVENKETNEFWTAISVDKINFNSTIDLPAGPYLIWFKMKDQRNNYTFSKMYNLTISSSTYEGWMALGTTEDNQTRLDMISVITPTRIESSFNLMASRGLPDGTKGAICFGFYPNNSAQTIDLMYLFTDDGGYLIEKEEFTTSDKSIINYTDFIIPTKLTEPIVQYAYTGDNFIVTKNGDAFAQTVGNAGSKFEDQINTTVAMTDPEFKVAPFIGYNAKRPGIPSRIPIFFDITNKRFMGFDRNKKQVLYPLKNPDNQKFDYAAKMDLVYMVGTAYDNGAVFAILKDANNKLNLAIMSISFTIISQHSYFENINGPEMANAKLFAFHSQFPLMFYAVGNKVYAYNWSNGQTKLEITLGANETVTTLKFHLYSNSAELSKYSDPAFLAQQYNLIVASYAGTENSGKIGFYKTSDVDYSLKKVNEYSGFCNIKDVMYRERR